MATVWHGRALATWSRSASPASPSRRYRTPTTVLQNRCFSPKMLLAAARSGMRRSGFDHDRCGFDHKGEAKHNSHSFMQKLHEAERRDSEANEAALAQAFAECALSTAETPTSHSVLQSQPRQQPTEPQKQTDSAPRLKGGVLKGGEHLSIDCGSAPNIPVRRMQPRSGVLITSPRNATNKHSCATDQRRRRGISINSKTSMYRSSAKTVPHAKGPPPR